MTQSRRIFYSHFSLLTGTAIAIMGYLVNQLGTSLAVEEIGTWRFLYLLIMATLLMIVQKKSFTTTVLWMHVTRSCLGVFGVLSFFYLLQHISLSSTMALRYTAGMFTGFLCLVFNPQLQKKRVWPFLLFLVVNFTGAMLTIQPHLSHQWGWLTIGILSGFAAGTAYFLIVQIGRHHEPDARILFYFSLGSLIICLLLCTISGHLFSLFALSLHQFYLVSGIGLLTIIAQIGLTLAYSHGLALLSSAYLYIQVIIAAAMDVFVLHHPISAISIVGILLIMASGIAQNVLTHRTARISTEER